MACVIHPDGRPTDIRHPPTDVRHPGRVKARSSILRGIGARMRFVTPALFAAAAVYIGWYNAQHTDRALVLPFLDSLSPSVAGNMAAQGALTVQVFGGLALVFTVREVVRYFRSRGADDAS